MHNARTAPTTNFFGGGVDTISVGIFDVTTASMLVTFPFEIEDLTTPVSRFSVSGETILTLPAGNSIQLTITSVHATPSSPTVIERPSLTITQIAPL